MGVFSRTRRDSAAIEVELREALVDLRALLGDGSHEVQLVTFEVASATAVLRFAGGCTDCEMTAERLIQGIEAHLRRRVPELRAVRAEC
jgi:Fe-S cluster biogenesis protein NfuA